MAARAGLTTDKITDAAVSLLESEGVGGLSLASLARELRVKTPSLYNHIGGIEDLRRALRLRGLSELGDEVRRAAVGRSGGRALRAIAHAYRNFALRHPALYSLTLRSTEEDDTELQQIGRELVEVAGNVLEGYGLSGNEALHGTRIIRSALHGFVSLETGGGYALPLDTDETFERMLDHLDAGLRSWLERQQSNQPAAESDGSGFSSE